MQTPERESMQTHPSFGIIKAGREIREPVHAPNQI